MKYTPGGYSWLAVAPESQVEQEIEKIENQIFVLHKEYEHSKDEKLLTRIKDLEQKIGAIYEAVKASKN